MRNGCCHKHGGKVRLNLHNRNAVTNGKRRRRVVAEKRLTREMLADGRDILRTIKRAHRAEMAEAEAALRDKILKHRNATSHEASEP